MTTIARKAQKELMTDHGAKYRLMEMYERVIEIVSSTSVLFIIILQLAITPAIGSLTLQQTQTAPVPFSVIAKLDNELRQCESSCPIIGVGKIPYLHSSQRGIA